MQVNKTKGLRVCWMDYLLLIDYVLIFLVYKGKFPLDRGASRKVRESPIILGPILWTL